VASETKHIFDLKLLKQYQNKCFVIMKNEANIKISLVDFPKSFNFPEIVML